MLALLLTFWVSQYETGLPVGSEIALDRPNVYVLFETVTEPSEAGATSVAWIVFVAM